MPSTPKPPTPRCTSAVLCGQVVFDKKTMMPSLVNVFFSFKITAEPGQSPPFALLVQLTDGLGDYELAADLRDLDAGESMVRLANRVPLADRLQKANVAFAFNPVVFAHYGRYDLIVTANGDSIAELTVDVEALG
jgi:hypothetical protein